MPRGFKIDEEEGETSKYFRSLQEIVDHYHVFLQYPFTSELPRERFGSSFISFLLLLLFSDHISLGCSNSWFHGDVSSQEAQELLSGQPEGTFLIRFSSQPGCFAASYVAAHNEIKHALIQVRYDFFFKKKAKSNLVVLY